MDFRPQGFRFGDFLVRMWLANAFLCLYQEQWPRPVAPGHSAMESAFNHSVQRIAVSIEQAIDGFSVALPAPRSS